jgi:hypothetical protein
MGVMDLGTGVVQELTLTEELADEVVSCEYLVASLGVSFHTDMLKDKDLATFVSTYNRMYPPSFFGDDLVISNYFASKNVPIVVVRTLPSTNQSLGVCFTSASRTADALQRGANGQCPVAKQLYCDIMHNLKLHNLWFIVNEESEAQE